ncbi:hypothetical protein E4U48_006138 [Claviceps purpurea]|nr:hypothetical protein E4U48_006138 [Claviceps purpurea]
MTIDVAWKTLKEIPPKSRGCQCDSEPPKPAYTDKMLFNTPALNKEFPPEEKIAMLAEAEAEDKAKNPTPDVDEAHFSRARGGLSNVEQGDSPATATLRE